LTEYYNNNQVRIQRFMLVMHEPDVEQEFLERIVKTSTCWLMIGGGLYPSFRNVHGHVASWLIHYGPITAGMLVLHKCDIFHCIRPQHLYLGTKSDNAKDAYRRGQMKQERALDGNKFEMARYAHVEIGLTQKQVSQLFNVGVASVGRALNSSKRGRYTKRTKK